MKIATLLLLALAATAPLGAALQLASPFGDHMVLQRGMPVPVWGTADPGDKITVAFAGQKKSATADSAGKWRVTLEPLKASAQPRDLVVSSGNQKSKIQNRKFTDVLVGEVWLCGGQSNMERQIGLRSGQQPIVNWGAEVAAATRPLIRQLYVTQSHALAPQETVTASWSVCSPDTVVDFTAVGYFFARDLHAALGVPVGIIHSSWGGTPAEAWTSAAGLAGFPEFSATLDLLRESAANSDENRRLFAEKLEAWFRANDPASNDPAWRSPGLDTSEWKPINVPALWEEQGFGDFDGIGWYRRKFDVPAAWAGKDLELKLGAIDDIDTTWVNGSEVGGISGYNLPRDYRAPATILKPTGNLIAVRVLDTGGGGGLWEPRGPVSIAPADGSAEPVSLKGTWLLRFSAPLARENRPPADVNQSPSAPTVLNNAMIAPLAPYAIRGATFYQGEANAGRAVQYRTLLPAMIADWRRMWGQGDFPFLFVQIAPWRGMGPEIREAQLIAWKNTPKTAMAVTIDVGDAEDIHPANKEPVGARLALAASAVAYGERIEYSGPVYRKFTVKGRVAMLDFTHVGGGLVAPGGTLVGFTIAGADGVFHPAQATIFEDSVIVSSPAVAVPAAVRYAWANVPVGNLFNRAGLPASPFRTDVK
ncbi:MAG TPA: sugar-binding domain-containing protein [Opitutaceae bacterium]